MAQLNGAMSTSMRTPPALAGRWSLTPEPVSDATLRAHAWAEALLARHGVVTRGAVEAEEIPGGFAAVYKVLAKMEDAGQCRRGYFVDGLGAALHEPAEAERVGVRQHDGTDAAPPPPVGPEPVLEDGGVPGGARGDEEAGRGAEPGREEVLPEIGRGAADAAIDEPDPDRRVLVDGQGVVRDAPVNLQSRSRPRDDDGARGHEHHAQCADADEIDEAQGHAGGDERGAGASAGAGWCRAASRISRRNSASTSPVTTRTSVFGSLRYRKSHTRNDGRKLTSCRSGTLSRTVIHPTR